MKITFAFALNNHGFFEKKHFGESDKFALYSFKKNKLTFLEELPNTFQKLEEEEIHASQKKGKEISDFLKEKEVKVLVSKQFGKNLKMVNQHFIPVIISEENPEEVTKILERNINWIQDELKNRKTDFMLFRIKTGVLKMAIN
jgi:predicted Fe-Mo cluster-binding NifX family protein